jgi:TolB protein
VFSPSFASDSSLLFHAGRDPDARLMIADLDRDDAPLDVATIVDGGTRDYHPRLSPDGRYLAFDSDRDGVRGVYLAMRDGSDVHRVSGTGFAAVPTWAPDMRSLAFVRGEPGRERVWNLWLHDLSTGEEQPLTSYRYGQVWAGSWFPDSRRLCYSHEDRLVILDIDTGRMRTFVSPRPGRLLRTPAVSPDGRRIAFQVMHDGVWLLDIASGAMQRIIDDPGAEEFAWAPDGGQLAYHSHRSGAWRIWLATIPANVTPELAW